MRLPQPFVQILLAIASLGALPCAHATSGDSTPFLLDTRNYTDSTPLFSVDTRSPDLIANTGITDSGGASFTITMEMLKVTGSGAITFTLVTGPVHGTLFLNGIAQGADATFTQSQIDAGLVSYQRAAGDPLTDTFEVAAMDDNAGLLGGNLSFAVAGIPGASGTLFLVDTRNYTDSTPLFSVDTRSPDLIANTGITDSGGASFTITMEMLKVTGGGAITFTLVTGPVHGTLFLNGIAQGADATFTQSQIDAGLVSYQRAAGDPLTDTFEVAAMDDNAGLLGGNLSFAVSGIPGASGTLFLVDTRNYTDSGDSTVHTDKRAYLTADTVPGSLRQAIANAAPGETVDFDTSLSGETIVLAGSSLRILKDLTIDASGLGGGVLVDGNHSSGVFFFGPGITNRLSGFTIRNGNDNYGGGINNSGDLTLDHMKLTDNHSGVVGGAIRHYDGRLTLNDTTVSGNSASEGGGIHVENNSTGPDGVILNNTTVSGNTATNRGGGIFQNVETIIEINHCTLADNTANEGGGIFTTGTNSSLNVSNSIVAANTASTSPDIHYNSGTITPTGINLIGDNSSVGAYFVGDGTFIGTSAAPLDPFLAPLGNYGGPTQTMALRAGSPAINTAGASALPTDQRGFTRVGAPDIGAYEFGNAAGYGAWAVEMIAEGLDASFAGNADEDPSSNGTEYALGTGVLISDPASPNNPEVITNGSGGIEITFGFNPIAAVDTRWIIERSTDLENFIEIYRYDGPTSTSTPLPGISAVVGATSITVTDPNPPSPNVFYRFGAQTTP